MYSEGGWCTVRWLVYSEGGWCTVKVVGVQ